MNSTHHFGVTFDSMGTDLLLGLRVPYSQLHGAGAQDPEAAAAAAAAAAQIHYITTDPIRYEYETGESEYLTPCPGFYCARTRLENGNWSGCGGCPPGTRKNFAYECVPCDDLLARYDWLYLGFMALLPIVLHFNATQPQILQQTLKLTMLILLSVVEVASAGVTTLLIWDPRGVLNAKACPISYLSDWYPIFYNPNPNYEETIYCAHEVVYPLYTIILVFLGFCTIFMLLWRGLAYLFGLEVSQSIYSALYFYPALASTHVGFGGLIYYIFPYITIVSSVISCAYHFSCRPNQKFHLLIWDSFSDWRNIVILTVHWFLHAYGIFALSPLEKLTLEHLALLGLVPIPAGLYIFTSVFTDPGKVKVQ